MHEYNLKVVDLGSAKQLDVVVVTYGQSELVRRCLESLRKLAPTFDVTVFVVDNGSPDDTVNMIRNAFPEVRLTLRPSNPGFAVSNNVALSQTTADFVLLLNPDTEVYRDEIEKVVGCLLGHPNVGLVGCRLLLTDGSLDHAAKRTIPRPMDAAKYFLSRAIGQEDPGRYTVPSLGHDQRGEVDAVNGAFMLVRRAALRDVGGLDEGFWMYGEDLDWCLRFKKAGWAVFYDGTATALHIKGASSGRVRSAKLNYHFHRSMAIFYRKHLATDSGRMVNVAVMTGIWARFLLLEARRRASSQTRFSKTRS